MAARYVETYQPLPWILTSGDVAKDADYVLTISTKEWRNKEIERLKWIHGQQHADAVQRMVVLKWPRRGAIRVQADAGKIQLDDLIFKNERKSYGSVATGAAARQ